MDISDFEIISQSNIATLKIPSILSVMFDKCCTWPLNRFSNVNSILFRTFPSFKHYRSVLSAPAHSDDQSSSPLCPDRPASPNLHHLEVSLVLHVLKSLMENRMDIVLEIIETILVVLLLRLPTTNKNTYSIFVMIQFNS